MGLACETSIYVCSSHFWNAIKLFMSGGQMQLRLGIWQRRIGSKVYSKVSIQVPGCRIGWGLVSRFNPIFLCWLLAAEWQRFIPSLLVAFRLF